MSQEQKKLASRKFAGAGAIAALFTAMPALAYDAWQSLPAGGGYWLPDAVLAAVDLATSASVGASATAARPRDGACCFPDGSCQVQRRRNCERDGGTYLGDGVSCAGNPCAPASGACCFIDQPAPFCAESTADDCAAFGGIYLGDGSSCDDPCPISVVLGACCVTFFDGANLNTLCYETAETDCVNSGGVYVGDGTLCVAANCDGPSPTGACCLFQFGGVCEILTNYDCVLFGGQFLGADTVCPPSGSCLIEFE